MTFKNLKIAITDETHLKAVCEVLESMGITNKGLFTKVKNPSWICVCSGRHIMDLKNNPVVDIYETVTLSDLLKMRDDMVKANAKSC